uniref:Zinc finger A20 and AN1 domain-containing stress-associated protein 9 n=1 Tax=Drosophila rhopaloa TaxID=1041015 RepID=A0A6P4F7I6_DRORH
MKSRETRDFGQPEESIISSSDVALRCSILGQPLASVLLEEEQQYQDDRQQQDHQDHPEQQQHQQSQQDQAQEEEEGGNSAATGNEAAQSQDSGAVQGQDQDQDAPKKRCDKCGKKLGLTGGFPCRCGGTYCAVHRYSDRHECNFDYREMGANEIRRDNPVVVASKLRKL